MRTSQQTFLGADAIDVSKKGSRERLCCQSARGKWGKWGK